LAYIEGIATLMQVANQEFADVVLENYMPNDIMWIQDYHLMVLPSLLKAAVPKMKVGFFLHTPFPSSGELLRCRTMLA
jgi:trehalose 6-phosphate synthase/phosphatase